MLLPDNIKPEYSIYFQSFLILKEMTNQNRVENLYLISNKKYGINYRTFCLCLDWLYLANIAKIEDNGEIIKCS